jgi:hypothetical protein
MFVKLIWITFVCAFVALLTPGSATAQELLLNRSFEAPVAPAQGNNFYATIPTWTVFSTSPAQSLPWNIVVPSASYANNPTAPPSGGGIQYIDINSAAGTIRQTITVPSQGMVDLSGWFSVRDLPQALAGATINIRNAGGTLVGTATTSFATTDPIGLWKQASLANIPVAAGTYIFEVVIPDFANFDLASLVFKPAVTVSKTNAAYSDPFNGLTNPKQIPGGVTQYTITVTTPASYPVSSNTIIVSDPTPANSEFVVDDIAGFGSGPAAFVAGMTGLAYTFTSLASATDDIEFSNDASATWSYTPVRNTSGTDPAVTNVRIRPKGTMAASSALTLRLRYLIK